jgi:hypothetical protein
MDFFRRKNNGGLKEQKVIGFNMVTRTHNFFTSKPVRGIERTTSISFLIIKGTNIIRIKTYRKFSITISLSFSLVPTLLICTLLCRW